MNFLNYKFYFLLGVIFTISCQNPGSSTDSQTNLISPDSLAMPHTQIDEQNLSAPELAELSQSKGLETSIITQEELKMILNNDFDYLQLFLFWSINNTDIDDVLEKVKKIGDEFDPATLKITLVSIDPTNIKDEVTLTIRENNLSAESFILEDNTTWYSNIENNYKGELPAIYLVNPQQDIQNIYTTNNSVEELIAIIEAFAL